MSGLSDPPLAGCEWGCDDQVRSALTSVVARLVAARDAVDPIGFGPVFAEGCIAGLAQAIDIIEEETS